MLLAFRVRLLFKNRTDCGTGYLGISSQVRLTFYRIVISTRSEL